MLKVNNFDDVARNSLDQWIYFLKNTELPERYSAQGLQLVESHLKYENMDATTKREYDNHLKDLRISQDMLETAEAKGEAKGKIEGIVEVVLRCYSNNLPLSLIANITNLSEEEVLRIVHNNNE